MTALSLAERQSCRQMSGSFSSAVAEAPLTWRTIVSSLTGCGSTRGSLNLSTHTQVEKVRPG